MKQRDIENIYPLSPAQQGMLFHTLEDPQRRAYFNQMHCILEGDTDHSMLVRAWQRVVDRYSMLRTAFAWEDLKAPVQIVLRRVTLPSEFQDWRDIPREKHQRRLEALLGTDRKRGFDLTTAPATRITILRLADQETFLLWSVHHLILDGWSMPLILGEVGEIYGALKEGRQLRLDRERPFAEYIAWLQKQDVAAARAHWGRILADFTTPNRIDLPRTDARQSDDRFAAIEFNLPKALSGDLRAFATAHQLTPATLFQGAWGLLLSRYSGQNDVVYGVTVSGRPPDLTRSSSMVGMFINVLPVRLRIGRETTLVDFLRELQTQRTEMGQFEYSRLVDIQRASGVGGGSRLFETILTFENHPIGDSLTGIGRVRRVEDIQTVQPTNYQLSVVVVPGDEVAVQIAYDRDHFDTSAIESMGQHLTKLLEGFCEYKSSPASGIPMLSEAEKKVFVSWNSTGMAYPRQSCIHDLFREQAAKLPDATAVVCDDASLSYHELDMRSNQIAHRLRRLGVGPEVPVGICMSRSVEMVAGLLGILKAGGVYVPLDPNYPPARLEFMLGDTQAPVLLTQEDLLTCLPEHRAEVVCLDVDWRAVANEPTSPVESGVTSDNLAYVIYTSGSTGQPKGVAICHRNTSALIHWARVVFGDDDLRGVLCSTSICFDLSVYELFVPLSFGGSVVLVENALAVPSDRGVTLINTVPSAITEILREGTLPSTVRTVNLAGEPLTSELSDRLYEAGVQRVYDLYGPSEGTTYSTYVLREPGGPATVGRPIANTQVHILDEWFQPVPIGVPGELFVGGDGVARGYLNRAELTAKRFLPDPFSQSPSARIYRTGDLARYLPDGRIEFLGRMDHQVKIRGFRIELGEIESVLKRYPAVEQAVVVAREDTPGAKRLVAYVVATEDSDVTPKVLRDGLSGDLPAYMVPSAFVLLDGLPLTPNGKVDRKALPAPSGGRPDLEAELMLPRNEREVILSGIWSEVLDVDEVGVHDNFFELGGDSILSIQIVSRANQAGVHVTPKDLFDHQTVSKLAAAARDESAVVAEQDAIIGEVPLTPIQHRFFEQDLTDKHHHNQAMLLEVRQGTTVQVLEAALGHVLSHHDALRARFVRRRIRLAAGIRRTVTAIALERIDLSGAL